MSRGSNRNKVEKVKKSGRHGGNVGTNFFPILIVLLVGMAMTLVVTIRSNANLQGALTMLHAKEMENVATRPMGTMPMKQTSNNLNKGPHNGSHNHNGNSGHRNMKMTGNHKPSQHQQQQNHRHNLTEDDYLKVTPMQGDSKMMKTAPGSGRTIFFPPGTSQSEMQRQLKVEAEKALMEAGATGPVKHNHHFQGQDQHLMASPSAPSLNQLTIGNGNKAPSNYHVNEVEFKYTTGPATGATGMLKMDNDSMKGQPRKLRYYYFDSVTQSFLMKEDKEYPPKLVSVAPPNSTYQKSLALSGKYQPSLCSDGKTVGFSDLPTLRSAVNELGEAYENAVTNLLEYRKFKSEYLHIMNTGVNFEATLAYGGDAVRTERPEQIPQYMQDFLDIVPDPFVICPYAHLRGLTLTPARNTIHINAEDVVIECDSCVIDSPGSHISHGAYGRNSIIRGITFKSATDSSLIFRYDGASATLEDCTWMGNNGKTSQGSVVDMNSISSVNFHRCQIGENNKHGENVAPRQKNAVSNGPNHSLTIRSKSFNES